MKNNLNINEEEVALVEQNLTTKNENTNSASQISPFFTKGETALLREIKHFNEVDNLLLHGKYSKNKEKNFGFFINVVHSEGKKIYYPILGNTIDEIFIAPNTLLHGYSYSFEVKIARRQEREKQANPFLLEAKTENLHEVIKLSEIELEVVKSEQKLKKIEKEVQDTETDLEKRRVEVDKQIENLLSEKQNEANQIIEQYNQTITDKSNEIEEKENLIANINIQISDIQIQLSEFSNKKSEMEATVNFLRQKINTCKNLEFMSEQDVNKYLDILKITPFEVGNNHLDFEKDLSANFPKLVTHIQNYL